MPVKPHEVYHIQMTEAKLGNMTKRRLLHPVMVALFWVPFAVLFGTYLRLIIFSTVLEGFRGYELIGIGIPIGVFAISSLATWAIWVRVVAIAAYVWAMLYFLSVSILLMAFATNLPVAGNFH